MLRARSSHSWQGIYLYPDNKRKNFPYTTDVVLSDLPPQRRSISPALKSQFSMVEFAILLPKRLPGKSSGSSPVKFLHISPHNSCFPTLLVRRSLQSPISKTYQRPSMTAVYRPSTNHSGESGVADDNYTVV